MLEAVIRSKIEPATNVPPTKSTSISAPVRSAKPVALIRLTPLYHGVELLRGLQDRFEQVILITHIEPVREGLDRVISVSYDIDRGCSVVQQSDPDWLDPESMPPLLVPTGSGRPPGRLPVFVDCSRHNSQRSVPHADGFRRKGRRPKA